MKTPVAVAILTSLAMLACGGKKEEAKKVDLAGELAKVKAAHQQHLEKANKLAELRKELAALREKAKLDAAETQRKGQLEAEVKAASQELDKVFTEDQNLLTSFLNTALNEAPQAQETREGLKLYAEDAMLNARDYMDEAGDYAKAIELLETAQSYFAGISAPVPQELTNLLEEAKKLRYITKERFDQVQKGMTKAQVKAITGTPLALNVREEEVKGRKVTIWLFRSENKDIASFYFDDKGKLYFKDWRKGS